MKLRTVKEFLPDAQHEESDDDVLQGLDEELLLNLAVRRKDNGLSQILKGGESKKVLPKAAT